MRLRALALILSAVVSVPALAGPRLHVPAIEDRNTYQATVRNERKERYANLKKSAQVDLAGKLFQSADGNENPIQSFVLLCEARDAAARAGNIEISERACAELVRRFDISLASARLGYFQTGVDYLIGEEEQKAYLSWIFKAVSDASRDDDFTPAGKMLTLADSVVAASNNDDWIAAARTRRNDFVAQHKAYTAAAAAIEVFRQNPSDPKANSSFGQYVCFAKGDWTTGLPLLLKGDDARLKALARQDLQEPEEAKAQLVIADGWFTLAEETSTNAWRIQQRAHDWYLRALPRTLNSADREHAKERILKLAATLGRRAELSGMWARVGESLSRRGYRSSDVVGGAFAKENFVDLPDSVGLLVGFHFGYGSFAGNQTITYLQPIYLTPKGDVDGQSYGKLQSDLMTVRAPAGYAVGAIKVNGGGGLDSIAVAFMRINGNHLDPDDVRVTEHLGGNGGDGAKTIDGDGMPVIGICGRRKANGTDIGLGLMFVAPVNTASAGE